MIALGCALLIAAVWFIALERIRFEHAHVISDAERQNANLALAFEEQTLGAIQRADQTLLYLKRRYEHDGKVVDLHDLTEELGVHDVSLIPGHLITDAAGNVLEAGGKPGPINVADRDFFGVQQRNAGSGVLIIAKPFTGRLTARTVISLSRPLTDAQGRFRGVAAVALDPNYFLESYRKFDVGSNGLIQLVGLDGTVRARRQGDRISSGTDMRESTLLRLAAVAPAGNFTSRGQSDGVSRFQSYRVLNGHPLVVSVGVSVDDALADFHSRERAHFIGATAMTLSVLLFGGLLTLSMRRRGHAVRALAASEERYRATFEQAGVGVVQVGLDGAFLKVNPKFCEMLGYSEEELLSRKFPDVTHPEDIARSKAMASGIVGGKGVTEFEKRYVRKDGRVVSAAVSAVAVRSADGAPGYFVTVLQDISARKHAEARLLEQLEELRRFQKVTVNRELRMLALEAEIRELRASTHA